MEKTFIYKNKKWMEGNIVIQNGIFEDKQYFQTLSGKTFKITEHTKIKTEEIDQESYE